MTGVLDKSVLNKSIVKKGVLNLVSVGPGFSEMIIPRAEKALRDSDVIVSYELYLSWIAPWLEGKEIYTPPLTQERERALLAIEKARSGAKVALISSGDIGIYAMAALVFEEFSEDEPFEINVIPGITSANACASLLGSPLSHDFATLSLSNLLCPWEWIEQRAQHIAQADLACVFYNVQSAGRQQGVYRILSIMLESKGPQTLCGVVKNAYRPGQQVSIHRLDELLTMQFDMLTTIVIGNRFTARKGNYIYTPRGYNDWAGSAVQAEADLLPSSAAWVFSGTSDGNALAREMVAKGHKVVVSTATEYGGELAIQDCPGVAVWAGRQGMEARRQALVGRQASMIVDATHPFATLISDQLMSLSSELAIPYIRYERPSATIPEELLTSVKFCNSMQEAAQLAISISKRISLATGSKDLATFLQTPDALQRQWFARITPEPELMKRAIELGLPRAHICSMQGPFSEAINIALWQEWKIDCIITKDSGEAGGMMAKVQAAKKLGVPIIVIAKPNMQYPLVASTFELVLDELTCKP